MADDVRLLVEGREIRAKRYEICRNVFTQPSNFGFTVGGRARAFELINNLRPGQNFELYINDTQVFTGRLDGFTSQGEAGRGTELTVRGRDAMALLLGACWEAEETLTDITYLELAKHAFKGLLPEGSEPVIAFTNDANRKAVTAAKRPTSNRTASLRALGKSVLVGAAQGAVGLAAAQTNATAPSAPQTAENPPARTIKIVLGQARYEGTLKPEFDRAGLIMMATVEGGYFLGAPDTTQAPSFTLVRRYDTDGEVALANNILRHDFGYETTGRHSSYSVNFKSGGGSTTRKGGGGTVVDTEMEFLGVDRPWVHKDEKIKTAGQAAQFVRRQMCDERRNGFRLVYTVRGHTTTAVDGDNEVLWAPETTVAVTDDELDLHSTFYIEGVRMTGDEKRGGFTELTVCRLSDVMNATPEDGFVGE